MAKAAWFKLRKVIWQRDHGRCCSPHCSWRSLWSLTLDQCEIDHIIPISRNGSNDPTNLRTLCKPCHALRADPSHERLRNRLVRQGRLPVSYKKLLW
ncbi:MAG: HNH endonuclease [Stenomitos frigidus ULC029]